MTSKKDLQRYDKLVRYGCICCRMKGWYAQPDMHHVLSGGRRTGNQNTLPLCPYHHRGVIVGNMNLPELVMGPSLAHGSKRFHECFGTEQELLAKVNEAIQ
jgi:hypothetical protein